jgi:hypothetical protein
MKAEPEDAILSRFPGSDDTEVREPQSPTAGRKVLAELAMALRGQFRRALDIGQPGKCEGLILKIKNSVNS